MVLHDVSATLQATKDDQPNDAELVEVAASSLRSKWLFENDLHVCNVFTVPDWLESAIREADGE